MGFEGENMSSGLCPMTMMPLLTTSRRHHNESSHNPIIIILNGNPTNNLINNDSNYPNADTHSTNVIQLPMLPPCTSATTNTNNYDHHNKKSTSFLLLHNSNSTSTGLGYYMEIGPNLLNNNNNNDGSSSSSGVKAKIMAHPHYHRLLSAYVNCQKVGAPAEVVARLEEACASAVGGIGSGGCSVGEDPALDQFMEAYCEMLIKYHQELSKPFNDAMLFLHRIDSQFKSLTVSPSSHFADNDATERNGSPEDDVDLHNNMIDPQAEDRELKGQLLRKYSGYLGSLKQEFMKKRKKGKLPKEARQQLLEWWSRHYKWPYPSESQKLALAESTGLDQKQINNWFINQRKRHWKPSEDMQFVVMDPTHPHYYMDNVMGGNPFPMDLSHTML